MDMSEARARDARAARSKAMKKRSTVLPLEAMEGGRVHFGKSFSSCKEEGIGLMVLIFVDKIMEGEEGEELGEFSVGNSVGIPGNLGVGEGPVRGRGCWYPKKPVARRRFWKDRENPSSLKFGRTIFGLVVDLTLDSIINPIRVNVP